MSLSVLTDFRTYAERCLKIKLEEGGRLLPFKLNETQVELDAAIEADFQAHRPARHVVLKTRRPGISTYTAGRFFHRVATRRYQSAWVLSHDGGSARKIFAIYERFWGNLPEINGLSLRPHRVGARGKEMFFDQLDSVLSVGSALTSDLGRGSEAQMIHFSEMASYPDPEGTLQAILPTVPEAGGSCIIVETTSKGGGTWLQEFWAKIKSGEIPGWTQHFYSWAKHPKYQMQPDFDEEDLSDYDKALMAEFGLTLPQIAWRRHTLANKFFGNEQRFRLEYPLTEEDCWAILGEIVWDFQLLEKIYERMAPLLIGHIDREGLKKDPDGPLSVWELPKPGCDYVIGVDPAEGLTDSDLTVASVWRVSRKAVQTDRNTWPVQVAEWAGLCGPIPFAQIVNTLGLFYNRALVSVEVNSMGRSCQNTMMNVYHYPNLHRWIPWDKYDTSHSKHYGWETSYKSKPQLFAVLDWLIRTHRITARSPELFREWLGIRRTGEYEDGQHSYEGLDGDDRVMAAFIGLVSWFQHLFQPKKLDDLGQVLSTTYGGTEEKEIPVGIGEPVPETIDESLAFPDRWIPAGRKRRMRDMEDHF